MSENRSPETCSSQSARGYDRVREWVVDGFALLTAAIVTAHYGLNGFLAMLVVFIGAYVVARVLGDVFWRSSLTWLCLLTGLILISTLVHTLSTMPLLSALLLTLLLPGIAQAYLIWALWPATGSLLHPLPLLCLAWLIALAIWASEPGTLRRLKSAWGLARPSR
ncbi:hypothetical protein RPMA_04495 [Tardiphaga alba]|uniref:Uncharacterized protein n=1 Tax=Tardiphaga alba TaxID=340268 RepID=A0ABX8A7D8_9BRAD|nr:hypothetical protein [Tardiphaga alba]QUS38190.1 hypothetical protein RPMA_04495 [Tardiphaga alba]